ncbi:MAG: c-type cytochrome [Anaerolineae bacterium]
MNWRRCVVALLAAPIILSIGVARAQGPIERGTKLYAENCAVCHGERGEGRVGATLAKDFPAIQVDAFLRQTIANGVSGSVMPAWSQAKGGPLTETEIDDIVSFIRTWATGAGTPVPVFPTPTRRAVTPIPTLAGVAGDPTEGANLYTENCAVCHGQRGEGRIGATLAKDFPSIQVDAFLRHTIANGVAETVMPAWSKAKGGPLSEEQIDDIVAFVRTWARVPTPTAAPPAEEAPPEGGLEMVPVLVLVAVAVGVVIVLTLVMRSRRS